MLTVEKIREVVVQLGKRYGIKNAYLFGSYAKNTATENSDVDLLIDKGDIHSFKEYYHFYEELVRELGKDVDLLTDKSLSLHFLDSIEKDRILLYAA